MTPRSTLPCDSARTRIARSGSGSALLRRLGTGRRCRPPTPTVRELGPDDHDVLDAVFAGLSAESRRLRFHAATPRLTARMRARLGAVDGHDHIALAAHAPDGTPIGIARLVRCPDAAGDADLAVEVVDAWQGRGVGRLLLEALAERGRAEGYRRLVAEVLDENVAMRVLLASLLPVTAAGASRGAVTLVAPLPHPTARGRASVALAG